MTQAYSIGMAVLIHYLLYSENFRELFSAVLELPQLIVMASICLFLYNEEVFAAKYKVYGDTMYSVMEVIICSIIIEFSLWMVWGIFEQILTCSIVRAFHGHLSASTLKTIVRAVISGFALAFFKYSLTATKSEDVIWDLAVIVKRNVVNTWNEAQATNSGSCRRNLQKKVQIESEPTILHATLSATLPQERNGQFSPDLAVRRSRSKSPNLKKPIHKASCKLSSQQAVELFINI